MIYAERGGTYIYVSNARLVSDIAADYAALGQQEKASALLSQALKQHKLRRQVLPAAQSLEDDSFKVAALRRIAS